MVYTNSDYATKFFFIPRILIVFLAIFIAFLIVNTPMNAQATDPLYIRGNDTLVVYKNVPGYNSVPERKLGSDKYTIRVRSAATNNLWIDVFTHNTYNRWSEFPPDRLDNGNQINYHYQTFTNSWSHAYGNIEMSRNTPVEVEIAFINGFTIKGTPIVKAAAHPDQKVSTQPVVTNGKIYFTISNPAQVAIDINGQMDDHHAEINPIGPPSGPSNLCSFPLHTISLYANPVMKKPSLTDPNVLIVEPGVKPPTDLGSKKIMYFKPGVHNLGINFKIFANKKYYIPGDAIVIGTLNNYGNPVQGIVRTGENIKIYGYGTISNWGIHHPYYIVPQGVYAENEHCPIFVTDAIHTEVNGITISDPCFHSLKLQSWTGRPDKKTVETVCKWIKIVSWRSNGDGIGSAELVEDSFTRTGDDASYIKGDRIRMIFWRDVHAAAFHMAGIPGPTETAPLRIEDCDVIYNRSRDIANYNGAIFQQRAEGTTGLQNVDLKVRDFRNSDPLSNLPVFDMFSFKVEKGVTILGSSYSGIVFENITVASTLLKQVLKGAPGAEWANITFDNVTFKGVLLTKANFSTYFDTNVDLNKIIFKNSTNYTLTLNSDSSGRIASIPGIEKYTEGTNVALTAIPNPGYEFKAWAGDATGSSSSTTVVMNTNKTVSATFQKTSTFVFNTPGNGTWTVPDGVTSIKLSAWGGGGAGGSTHNDVVTTANIKAGGGAGASYASRIVTVSPGDVISFTVGKGGEGTALPFTHLSKAEAGGNTFASLNAVQVVQAVGGPGGENIFQNPGSNGLGGVVTNVGNAGSVINLGGNGGNAGGLSPNVGSGAGGGSAGADGAGGAGANLSFVGAAGAGGGAAGGAGTNSTSTAPLRGGFPGGGGAGSTIRINGAANTYNVGSGGGNGQLIISINGNLSISDIDKMEYKYIYVYPNPATDKLYINSENQNVKKIELVDFSGKVIFSDNAFDSLKGIDLTFFARGLYIVKIQAADATYIEKFIKK
jgi:uncharacterized protein YjbI with pentapeptide repeats